MMEPMPVYFPGNLFLVGIFLFGALSAAILTPVMMRLARRWGAIDRGGYRRVGQGRTPLLGGLAVALPVVAFLLMFGAAGGLIVSHWRMIHRLNPAWLTPLMNFAVRRGEFSRSFIVLAIGGGAILLLGFVDDLRGMRARVKLLAQFAVAVFICLSGYVLEEFYIPLVGTVPLSPDLGVVVSILWIVGLINAFNLIDGLDGLASGVALIVSAALVALGVSTGNVLLAFAGTALAGALAAFLFFNFPPARIYLGDTGSMFIGYLLATVTLMGTYKGKTAVIILGPLLALSYPIFETLVSMIRRFVRGVPIFSGDRYHTHHRLLDKGFSKRRVVLTIYGVTFLLAAAAYLSRLIPADSGWAWLPGFTVGVTLFGIAWWTGYLRQAALGRIFHRRRRNAVLAAFSRYAIQSLTSRSATIRPGEILDLCRREMRLSYLEARFEKGRIPVGSSGEPPRDEGGRVIAASLEELRLQTIAGMRIVLRYRFDHQPFEHEAEDACACLAQIFEQSGTSALLAKVIREDQLSGGRRERVPSPPLAGS